MMRLFEMRKLKPLSSSMESLSHQFLQRCSVSGTAKGKAKVKAGQPLKRSNISTKKGQKSDGGGGGGGGQRNAAIEQTIDDCLHAAAPLRFLKPKEREREAEREKMGLLSEARKKEIENLKKMKSDEDKPGIIGTVGLDLISLGLVDADKIPKYELTAEDGKRLAKEFSRYKMRKHRERQKAETEFLKCKKEAIEALPPKLREAALVPDLTLFPTTRYRATLTPPIEGYMEKIMEAAKRTSSKTKLR